MSLRGGETRKRVQEETREGARGVREVTSLGKPKISKLRVLPPTFSLKGGERLV